jgi:hypothetical protein
MVYGCEPWCLTAEAITRLRNWQNMRIREVCWVIMCQAFFSPHRLGELTEAHWGFLTREPPCEPHLALSRSPKRLMLPWVLEPRVADGQEMTYGKSLGLYRIARDFESY